jgi:hypothetical protein
VFLKLKITIKIFCFRKNWSALFKIKNADGSGNTTARTTAPETITLTTIFAMFTHAQLQIHISTTVVALAQLARQVKKVNTAAGPIFATQLLRRKSHLWHLPLSY